MPDLKYGLQYNLNRIANLLVNDIPTLDAQGAANVWAGTTGLDLLGALNYKAGTFGLGLNAVCNALAGTVGLDADAASASFSSVSSLLASAAFYISADGATANRQKILNQGSAGSLLDVSVGSTAGSGLSVVPADGYVYLPGVVQNYLSIPSAGTTWPTGDFDVRIKVNWDGGGDQFITKYNGAGSTSWLFEATTTSTLRLRWSVDGTTFITPASSGTIPAMTGSPIWLRATLDVDNGASGYTLRYYYSTDGSTWIQSGSDVVGAGVTSIFASTWQVEIGSRNNGGSGNLKGRIYRAQVFNGIEGVKVLDVSCADASTQRNTFQALTGQTVTINESGADSNDPKFLEWTGTNYLYTVPSVNAAITTPNTAALQITGDIDIRAYVALDDWTPAVVTAVAGKWNVELQKSYYLRVQTDGALRLVWRTSSGGADMFAASSVATGINDGEAKWIRATLDVDNGASGYDVKFYTSNDGSTWTQLGTTQTGGGTTSIFAGTDQFEIGSVANGSTQTLTGKVYRVQVYNGINGTKVLDVDTSVITSGAATSFTALTGQTVTINRATSGRKTTVVKRPVWLFGTDDYLSVNNRWVRDDNDKYIKLPGVAGNYLSVPDAANLDIVGDLDLRAKVALDDWTPSSVQLAIAKYNTQYSFYFGVNVDGTLTFRWSADGSTSTIVNSTSATGFADNSTNWIRVAFDVDNGSSGSTAKFYTSSDGVSWTQLGSDGVTAGVTSIFSSNSNVEIGSRIAGSSLNLAGKVYQAQIFNGINGTKVLDIDTSLATPAVSTFTAVTGQTVTINGSSVDVVNGNSVYLPGVSGNYMSVPDSAALNIAGDIDVRVRVALDDWTPSTNQSVISKLHTAGPQKSWRFWVGASGSLAFGWYNGTTDINIGSTANASFADGTVGWIRATLDVDNGASGNTVTFYTSTNGTMWTQLGSPVVTAGTTSIASSTAVVALGGWNAGTQDVTSGRILRAQVFNGINGTKVLDVDPNVLTSVSQTTFTERSSNAATVTINKSGTGYVSTPVLTSGYVYPTGVSNLSASATDFLNFSATDSFTVVYIRRTWATPGTYSVDFSKGTTAPYYQFYHWNANTMYFDIHDGTNQARNQPAGTFNYGDLYSFVAVVNRSNQTLTQYWNGVSVGSVSTSAVGSTVNNAALQLMNQRDGEVFAAAVFRRVLTTDEIATLNTYFQGIAA